MGNLIITRILFLVLISLLAFCSKSSPTENPTQDPNMLEVTSEPKYSVLKSAEEKSIITESTLNLLRVFIPGYTIPKAQYDVQSINIVYKTVEPWTNKSIDASGVLLIPILEKDDVPMISLHHGTIDPSEVTPSQQGLGLNEITLANYYASLGFIVSYPDYLGYGSSSTIKHPYEHLESLGTTSHDMLKASKEYLDAELIKYSKELFLIGYSEGGTATIGHAEIAEDNFDFELLHSFVGGGAYDKKLFFELLSQKDYEIKNMPNFIWALSTLNLMDEKLNRPWSEYLNEPFAETISNLDEINGLIDTDLIDLNPQELFKSQFARSVLEGSDKDFIEALDRNSIQSLKLEKPISFYYVDKDEATFSDDISKKAHQYLLSLEVESNLIELEAEGHFAGAIEFYWDSYNDMISILED